MSTEINITKNLTLTTTGTSGASTLVGNNLNIPQYSGGGGGGSTAGVHGALVRSGLSVSYLTVPLSAYISSATTNLRLSAVPFIPIKTFTSASLYINCTTLQAGAVARILIYSELNGVPDQKLYESATLDLSTTGIKTATTSFTFNAGTTYFITTHTQGTAQLTFIPFGSIMPMTISGINVPTTVFNVVGSYPIGSAPATFGVSSAVFASVILVGITSA